MMPDDKLKTLQHITFVKKIRQSPKMLTCAKGDIKKIVKSQDA